MESSAETLFAEFLATSPATDAEFEAFASQHAQVYDALLGLWRGYRRVLSVLGDPAEPPLRDPTRRYEFRGEIATGGMGHIVEVYDHNLQRTLAMKIVRDTPSDDHVQVVRARQRLLTEARILGQLEHPGIVPVHEVGEDENGRAFFTMQRVQGRCLDEAFADARARCDGWTIPRGVDALLRACEAVAHAHDRGIIHRDLKPANVMIGSFGEVFVMDWGLARDRERPTVDLRSERSTTMASPSLTMDGDVLGTPFYMAPEQAAGRVRDVDRRSDVYSAGAMLYHLLSGSPPYATTHRSRSPRQILQAVRDERPASLEAIVRRENCSEPPPAELVSICERAMARSAADRYPTMREFADDLRAFLDGRVVGAHATGAWAELRKWTRRHRPVVAISATLVATLIGSSLALAWLYGSADRARSSAEQARAQSFQRVGARRGIGYSQRVIPAFDDNFDDGKLSRLLIGGVNHDLVDERDGYLVLTAPVGRTESATWIKSDPFVASAAGDFDLEVRFRLIDFTTPIGPPRAERIAQIGAIDLYTDRRQIAIGRHAEIESASVGANQSYRALDASDGGLSWVATDDASGSMRIRRRGTWYEALYEQDGEWRLLHRAQGTAGRVALWFGSFNFYSDTSHRFEIDSIRYRYTLPDHREPLTQLTAASGHGTVDPRLRIHTDCGLVSGLDGRIYLEKPAGRAGFVGVLLDDGRWRLTGNWTLQFDYEAIEIPDPTEPGQILELAVTITGTASTSQETFAKLGIRTCGSDGALTLFASGSTSEENQVRAPRRAGRFRVRRRGSTLLLEHFEDAAWRTILERAAVPRQVPLFFRIALRSDRSGFAAAAIANLRVTHVEER